MQFNLKASINKKGVLNSFFRFSVVVVSSIIYSLAVIWFLEPANLLSIGVTAISQVLNRLFGLGNINVPIGVFSLLLNIPLCVFDLQGNEDDFPVFNFILKSAREGNIHLYIYKNEEQSEFIFNNLRPYLDVRNIPAPINMITMDEYKQLWTSSTNEDGSINNEIHYFDKDNLPEEDEDENSDC